MTQRYSSLHIALHWSMAVVVSLAWFIGSQIEDIARGPDRVWALGWHVLLGLSVLALLLPRLLARLHGPVPVDAPAQSTQEVWEHRLAGAAHLLLYVVMLLMPVTGLISAMTPRVPIQVLGLFTIPNLLVNAGIHGLIEGVHALLSNVLLGTVILHVVATLYHGFIRRDGVPGRMIPWLAK